MYQFKLQDIMGELVADIMDDNTSAEKRERILENAQAINGLAKQMINNGDLIVRSYKLIAEGKAPRDQIIKMIEGENEQYRNE